MNLLKIKWENFKNLTSPLTAFFLGTGLACCAYALMTSILSVRLDQHGLSTSKAGLVLVLYYVGYIFASLESYKVINRVGHIRSFAAHISAFAALSLTHAFYYDPMFWGILRLLEGYCIGTATMCLESWLNTRANNKNRGTIMSFYMITTYLGSSLAQLMLNIPDKSEVIIYMIVSILFSISLIPITLTALPTPDITKHKSMPLLELYKKTPVGVIACFVSGCFVGTFYMLGAIYTKKLEFSMQETSLFMFCGVFGGMLVQLPIGKLSDKMDRRFVMIGACTILCLITPFMPHAILHNKLYLTIFSGLLGACTFIIYPVCVSHINDLIDDSERIQASGKLILMQGSGLILGPIIVSALMEKFGNNSFAYSFGGISLVFILFTLVAFILKPKIQYIRNTPTEPIPTATTQVFDHLATKDTLFEMKTKNFFRKLKNWF
ncbi:MAG: MFS transporter [Alphaproteobacteria bacterium]